MATLPRYDVTFVEDSPFIKGKRRITFNMSAKNLDELRRDIIAQMINSREYITYATVKDPKTGKIIGHVGTGHLPSPFGKGHFSFNAWYSPKFVATYSIQKDGSLSKRLTGAR